MVLDENIKVFVMHMNSISLESKIIIHPSRKAQIVWLLAEEVIILVKYSNYADVCFKESVKVLPERIGMNKHAIELEEGKQPLYRPIYSLGPVKPKTLKIYIKTNLVNGSIQASQSPVVALIVFVRKPNAVFSCAWIIKV